ILYLYKDKTEYEIRESLGSGALEIFRIVVEDQGVTGFEQLHEFPLDARIGGSFPVLQVIHVAFQERVFREKFHHAKRGAAGCEDIHGAVFVASDDVEDFRGTSNARNAFGKREEHAEFRSFLKTVFDHLAITRFKNM